MTKKTPKAPQTETPRKPHLEPRAHGIQTMAAPTMADLLNKASEQGLEFKIVEMIRGCEIQPSLLDQKSLVQIGKLSLQYVVGTAGVWLDIELQADDSRLKSRSDSWHVACTMRGMVFTKYQTPANATSSLKEMLRLSELASSLEALRGIRVP